MDGGTRSGATLKRLFFRGALRRLLFGALLTMSLSHTVQAAPGDPDIAFGTDGKVLTDISGAGSDDEAKAVVLEPGGKILASGRSTAGASTTFALARYHSDGSLDASSTSRPTTTGESEPWHRESIEKPGGMLTSRLASRFESCGSSKS